MIIQRAFAAFGAMVLSFWVLSQFGIGELLVYYDAGRTRGDCRAEQAPVIERQPVKKTTSTS